MDYICKPGNICIKDKPRIIGSANPQIYRALRLQAEYMRMNPTDAEKILWNVIKNKKLGHKFRQQHIIDRFIVDFYCIEKSLAIEADGTIHDNQKERDEDRDIILNSLGVNILRFSNTCIENDLTKVIQIVIEKLNSRCP